MTTLKDKPDMGPIEVITSVQRRRRWTPEEKRALLEEAGHPGSSVSAVARKYGVNPNQMFHWRKLTREGALVAVGADDQVVPPAIAATAGISGEMVRDLMAESIEARFGLVDRVPLRIEWPSDNGSAYTAHETRMFAASMGLLPCTTPVQSPESNGMAEGFINIFKPDYAHINRLDTAEQVLAQLPKWFEDYNELHPHQGLKTRLPRGYRKALMATSGCPV